MHTTLVLIGLISVALSVFSSQSLAQAPIQGRAVTDTRVVDYVVRRADSLATFGEFSKSAIVDVAIRDEVAKYVNEASLASVRLPEVFASGNSFVVDMGLSATVEAEFISKPRAHLKIAHRVIYLDKATKDIASEIFEVLGTKTSRFDLLVPRAHAWWGDLSAVFALFGRSAKSHADAAQKPETATQTPVGDDLAELREDMKQKNYTFKCENPKDFGFPVMRVKLAEPVHESLRQFSHLKNFKFEKFDKEGGKFVLKTSREEGDPNAATFHINAGVAKPERLDTYVATQRWEIKQEDAAARRATTQPKGKKAKRSQAASAPAPSRQPLEPADLRFFKRVVPQINYKAIMSCCVSDPSKCAEKAASGASNSPGASGATGVRRAVK